MEMEECRDELDELELELDDVGGDTFIFGAAVVNRKDDAPCTTL